MNAPKSKYVLNLGALKNPCIQYYDWHAITHTRKSQYLCRYVYMYVSVYVAIRRPRAYHVIVHVQVS